MTRTTPPRPCTYWTYKYLAALLASGLTVGILAAFAHPNPQSTGPSNPDQLVRSVVRNELADHPADRELWKYQQLKKQGPTTDEFQCIEMPQGEIHRLIARNGTSISPDEARKEDVRIEELLGNPDALRKHWKSQEEDAAEAKRLMEMLPDAFEYSNPEPDGNLMKLQFKPRPSFRPQHREGTVFHAMEGHIWVDPAEKRIAGIDGKLIEEVKFGGGFLGHLARGGTFSMRRADVGGGHWEMTHLNVNMDGKALLLKTISVHHSEENSEFQRVRSDLTLQQASQMLRQEASRPAARTAGNSLR